MRKLFVYAILMCSYNLFAQWSIGAIGEPTLNITRLGNTPKPESDSIKAIKVNDITLSAGIEIRYNIDRYQSISFIPGYHQTNLKTVQEDLRLFDVVHPQLPEIRDFSQAATKNAFIRYRYKYVGTQIIYSKDAQAPLPSSKMHLELGGGIGLYYLLDHDVHVRTEGFAYDGDFTQVIKDSTGTDARPFHINAAVNIDFNYEVAPKVKVIAGIRLQAPITSAVTSSPNVTIFTPGFRFGIRTAL